MKIYIRGTFVPLGDVKITVFNSSANTITYQNNLIEFCEASGEVESGKITAIKEQDITDDEFAYVMDTEDILPRNEQFESYQANQYRAVRTILSYVQVFDGVFELDSDLQMRSKYEWSEDRSTWLPIPDKRVTTWRGADLRQTLAETFLAEIEQLVNDGIPVFLAFNHLYKAYDETNPRFKWINGTIAAEHAFKEFLSLFDRRAESLMLNIPSPPIEKLYKTVLEAYTGQASSMYKQLQRGATKRNELVHRPASPTPDLKETNIYLHQVEVAIFELYTLLYPKNVFLGHALKAAQYRLNHVIEGGTHFQ